MRPPSFSQNGLAELTPPLSQYGLAELPPSLGQYGLAELPPPLSQYGLAELPPSLGQNSLAELRRTGRRTGRWALELFRWCRKYTRADFPQHHRIGRNRHRLRRLLLHASKCHRPRVTVAWLAINVLFHGFGQDRSATLHASNTQAAQNDPTLGDVWTNVRPAGGLCIARVLRNTPLRHLNSSVYLVSRQRNLGSLYRQVESAEAIHFWAMVLFTLQRQAAVAALFVLIQLLVNVYPILHLRTLRGRLDEFFARQHAKTIRS